MLRLQNLLHIENVEKWRRIQRERWHGYVRKMKRRVALVDLYVAESGVRSCKE